MNEMEGPAPQIQKTLFIIGILTVVVIESHIELFKTYFYLFHSIDTELIFCLCFTNLSKHSVTSVLHVGIPLCYIM